VCPASTARQGKMANKMARKAKSRFRSTGSNLSGKIFLLEGIDPLIGPLHV